MVIDYWSKKKVFGIHYIQLLVSFYEHIFLFQSFLSVVQEFRICIFSRLSLIKMYVTRK